MACGPCRSRQAAANTKYVWTADDGSESITYNTKIEAKAKVMRAGGSYVTTTIQPST